MVNNRTIAKDPHENHSKTTLGWNLKKSEASYQSSEKKTTSKIQKCVCLVSLDVGHKNILRSANLENKWPEQICAYSVSKYSLSK